MGLDYRQRANVKTQHDDSRTVAWIANMAESLSKAVSDDLLARIQRGEYNAGDRLPSEHELMAKYGVGRNTVREAMHSLRTLGIVEIRPRLGARVLDSGAGNALASSAVSVLLRDHTVIELYEVRLILEPAAAEKAAIHRTDEDLIAMRRALTHYRVAYETGTPVWEADIEFHQAIADACGNTMVAKVLAPVSDLLSNARRATGTLPAAVALALDQHDEIAAAIEARARKRARRAMTTHIESGIWALNQLRELNQPTNPPSVTATLAEPSTPSRRRVAGSPRSRAERQAAG
jgi:GntR family transcriptional regulator, transcriptional repressor for pyruvate dehydrogenase complex